MGFKFEEYIAATFYDPKSEKESYDALKQKVDYLYLLFDGSGIFLAYARLLEPFVFKHFKKFLLVNWLKFKQMLSCRRYPSEDIKRMERLKYSDVPLCSFANSAFNIEFVYLILLGINNLMDIRNVQLNQ